MVNKARVVSQRIILRDQDNRLKWTLALPRGTELTACEQTATALARNYKRPKCAGLARIPALGHCSFTLLVHIAGNRCLLWSKLPLHGVVFKKN
jgi:hypothetical protein